jgi:hypothetical protein
MSALCLASCCALAVLGLAGPVVGVARAAPPVPTASPHAQLAPAATTGSEKKTEPPPRPASEGAEAPARLLFEAIVQDQPARVESFFFPRDAFLLVKAMAHPERYWDKLHERFVADIHALHQRTPDLARATFVRLELSARGGYVRPGEEGNRLPYWAARHALLHYRVGDQPRVLEVRVLITWKDVWYVIHLNEFH